MTDISHINFNTLMLFRCTTLEYASKFLETGNIRFGRPQEWIDYCKKSGMGRGDLLEGAFAGIKELDKKAVNICKSIRPNVIMNYDPIGEFYFFQSNDALNMRTFCLFGLNDIMFSQKLRGEDKKVYPTGTISKKYFKDLFPDVTKDNYDLLKPSEKPVLLMIHNPREFFERIRSYLRGKGLNDNEFIISPVSYVDKYKQFIVNARIPRELFIKDLFFKNQSEIRIVITSTRRKIIDTLNLCDGIVDIGVMKDIADYQEYYFDDFCMQLRGNSILFPLSKPIVTKIDDPMQLIGIVHQALRDELEPEPMGLEDIDKYIAPIVESLETQFDILFDRSYLTFYRKDNSQSWELVNIWEILFSHGLNYYNEKEYENSFDSFTKAINIDPSRPEAWYHRACSLYWLKRYDEMFSDIDEAIKLAPTNSEYLATRVSMMEQLNSELQ